MKENHMVLKQLDSQLLRAKRRGSLIVPEQSWVRTLRKTLGMTIQQFAIH